MRKLSGLGALGSLALLCLWIGGCKAAASNTGSAPEGGNPQRAPGSASKEPRRLGKAEIVRAQPAEDVRTAIRAEMARADQEERILVVYVGASWCEPCQRFHRAVEAGELDQAFPSLRLLEFDKDQDDARLSSAGYSSRLIPLLVVPNPSGEGSNLRMEGSIKGDQAVANIVPRLQQLIQQVEQRRSSPGQAAR